MEKETVFRTEEEEEEKKLEQKEDSEQSEIDEIVPKMPREEFLEVKADVADVILRVLSFYDAIGTDDKGVYVGINKFV